MKRKLFAGALVLSLFGGAALAQEAVVVSDPTYHEQHEHESSVMRGVTISAGGGIEGYTGGLNGLLQPGFGWGVTAAIKPSKVFGLELGYTGATNELQDQAFDVNGADVVRNGGQVVATVGLGAAPVQPYLLAGAGINFYNVRASGGPVGDDTSGNVPLGGGVRAYIGHFTADARIDWSFMWGDDELALNTGGGRYAGTLSLGGTF